MGDFVPVQPRQSPSDQGLRKSEQFATGGADTAALERAFPELAIPSGESIAKRGQKMPAAAAPQADPTQQFDLPLDPQETVASAYPTEEQLAALAQAANAKSDEEAQAIMEAALPQLQAPQTEASQTPEAQPPETPDLSFLDEPEPQEQPDQWKQAAQTALQEIAQLKQQLQQFQMSQAQGQRPQSYAEQIEAQAAEMRSVGLDPTNKYDVFTYNLHKEFNDKMASMQRHVAALQQHQEMIQQSARTITQRSELESLVNQSLKPYGRLPEKTKETIMKLALGNAEMMSPKKAVKSALEPFAEFLQARVQKPTSRTGPTPASTATPPSPAAWATAPALTGKQPAQVSKQLKAMSAIVPAKGAGRFNSVDSKGPPLEALESMIFRST